jgi:Flp pilus assembly protein TadG
VTLANGPRARAQRGATLVEFALVVPIVVLLLTAAVDLAFGVYAYNTVANAARTGARVAAVNQILTSPECDETRPLVNPADPHWSITACTVEAAVQLGVTAASVVVSFRAPPGSSLTCTGPLQVGCIASVTVQYSYSPITPLVGGMFPAMSMDSTSEVPIERVFP